MISDREMVLDALTSIKHDIIDLTKAAEESSDPNVRQTMLQFRNQAEQTQNQLSMIAAQKGWYVPSPPANDSEIQQVKQQLSRSIGQTTTMLRV